MIQMPHVAQLICNFCLTWQYHNPNFSNEWAHATNQIFIILFHWGNGKVKVKSMGKWSPPSSCGNFLVKSRIVSLMLYPNSRLNCGIPHGSCSPLQTPTRSPILSKSAHSDAVAMVQLLLHSAAGFLAAASFLGIRRYLSHWPLIPRGGNTSLKKNPLRFYSSL